MKNYTDIRQGTGWTDYLKILGWKNHLLSNGASVQYRNLLWGTVAKIQRPANFTKETILEIDLFCKSIKAILVKIELSKNQDMAILENAGYVRSEFPLVPTSTMLIDLTLSETELWEKVSHSGKYAINRAKREGTRTEVIKHPSGSQIENFFKVLKYTGNSKHFYVPPIKLLESQIKGFGDASYIVNVYDSNGVLAGAKFYVSEKNLVLYVSGGTTSDGRGNKAGFQLMWDSILYFKNSGFEVLDLEGVKDDRFPSYSRHWGGFTEFKEKFGGTIVEFPYPMVKYYNSVFKFLAKYTPINF